MRVGGGVERFFNFLVGKKVLPELDDRLSMIEAKDGRFTVRFMYKLLSISSDATFSFRSIGNPCVPWGKISTLD